MTSRTRKSARAKVRRAQQKSDTEEQIRTQGTATRKAVARVHSLKQRTGVRGFLFENGLTLVMLSLFVLTLVGRLMAGHSAHNAEQEAHGQSTVSVGEYVTSSDFLGAVAENWESEFLQMGLFVLLSVFLYRGSSESKRIDEPEPVDQDPRDATDDPKSPWPVRQGR